MRQRDKSRKLSLVRFEPLGNDAFTRRAFRERLRVGTEHATVYTCGADCAEAIKAGRMRASLVVRVSRAEGYSDTFYPLKLFWLGDWYLVHDTKERE